jgi:hypothetical protein
MTEKLSCTAPQYCVEEFLKVKSLKYCAYYWVIFLHKYHALLLVNIIESYKIIMKSCINHILHICVVVQAYLCCGMFYTMCNKAPSICGFSIWNFLCKARPDNTQTGTPGTHTNRGHTATNPQKDKWWRRQLKSSKCTRNEGRPLKMVME